MNIFVETMRYIVIPSAAKEAGLNQLYTQKSLGYAMGYFYSIIITFLVGILKSPNYTYFSIQEKSQDPTTAMVRNPNPKYENGF